MAEKIIIKKYANRRLYNTQTSTYVTLDSLAEMVRGGQEFEVVDAKTGDDITRQVLAQIIFDEESKETALLPTTFMKELIRFYDRSLEKLLPQYLEMAIKAFSPENFRPFTNTGAPTATSATPGTASGAAKTNTGGTNPASTLFDPFGLAQQNMNVFNQTMQMFNPFGFASAPKTKDEEIAELKAELEKLQKRLADSQKAQNI